MSGLIEMDYSVSDEARPEIPEWRLELSRRLQEIKTKRDAPGSSSPPAEPAGTPPAAPPEPDAAAAPEPAVPADARSERKPRRPARPPRPEPASESEKPPLPIDAALPLFRPMRPPEIPDPAPSPPRAGGPEAIQQLIDQAVARQVQPAAPRPTAQEEAPASGQIVPPTLAPAAPPFQRPSGPSGGLILLSRTLAGMVDLIIVGFCAVGLILAADTFSGIEILDGFSMANYGILLLATYFVYSVFFLVTAGQTIGMMITDLRLTDEADGRPSMSKILGRCALFVVALLAAGLGLLWGCFDREARCAHDRFSGTRVVRVSVL